jgi:DNA-binding CsgD family transcriptional regulator
VNGVARFLDSVYRLDFDLPSWQSAIAREVSERQKLGPGVLSYEFDAAAPDEGVVLGSICDTGDIRRFRELTGPLHDQAVGDAYRAVIARGTHAGTFRELARRARVDRRSAEPFARAVQAAGFDDIWAVCAVNPDATGIVFAVPFAQTRVPPGRWHHTWTRLGVHIAASYRLRKKIAAGVPRSESRTDQADGVFEPGGADLELRSGAVGDRDALRHAVRTIDKARAREARGGSGELLSVWHGLLHGRWSLFDQVESDGKRFVLVFENDPEAYGAHELTKRERQVATYAAQGHSNKMIGYELGIAPSTVAAHLKSALRRLGLRRRTDLVWIYGRTKE